MSQRTVALFAALTALLGGPGSLNAPPETKEKPTINEAVREKYRAKRRARNLRRAAKWNGSR